MRSCCSLDGRLSLQIQPVAQTRVKAPAPQDLELLGARVPNVRVWYVFRPFMWP
jgi:hypothetical protein